MEGLRNDASLANATAFILSNVRKMVVNASGLVSTPSTFPARVEWTDLNYCDEKDDISFPNSAAQVGAPELGDTLICNAGKIVVYESGKGSAPLRDWIRDRGGDFIKGLCKEEPSDNTLRTALLIAGGSVVAIVAVAGLLYWRKHRNDLRVQFDKTYRESLQPHPAVPVQAGVLQNANNRRPSADGYVAAP